MQFLKLQFSVRFLFPVALLLLLSGCRQTSDILPRTLYYLDGTGDSAQVWRMELDGITRTQVTHEPAGVDGFSISPGDGALALVSGNKLHLVSPDYRSRQMIADGGEINGSNLPAYLSMISNPLFSPDGKTLAYSWNGIHLFEIGAGVDNHILPNPVIVNGTAQDYAKGAYSPGHWSPDGAQLIVVMIYYEGCTLSVLEPATSVLLALQPEEAVGCMTAWSADGLFVLSANPYFSGAQMGLWQFDARTGQQTFAFTRDEAGHNANFIGWPYQTGDGTLYFFHAGLADLPPPEAIRLRLVRLDAGNPEPMTITPGNFNILTALWTPAGDGVLVVGDHDGTGKQLLLIDPSSGASRVLIEEADQITRLVWGP